MNIWHSFSKCFITNTHVLAVAKYKHYQNFNAAVYRWAKRHKEVVITHCDDMLHAGSGIVLIPHAIWGVTMVLLPQLSNTIGAVYLYPEDMIGLEKSLKTMRKKYKMKLII